MTRFTDVPEDHPFYADIEAMAAEGITSGIGNNLFDPEGTVTRGQMMAFMNRLWKKVKPPKPTPPPPEPEPEPEPTPEPPPPPPPSSTTPPLVPVAWKATPNIPLPGLLQPIIDPTYGTRITRIANAGQRHAYARIQPWSPSEKYLHLYYGGNWLLDGRTYEPIKQINPPYVATWTSDTHMVGTRGNRLVGYNVDTGQDITMYTAPGNISLGEGEGAPSDDFRYWALQSGATIRVFDRGGFVMTSADVGAVPNNCTMSSLGTYVIVQFNAKGTGSTQGTWVYDRQMNPVRQLTWVYEGKVTSEAAHMDVGLTADGKEVAVLITNGGVTLYELASGAQRNLVKLPNVWAWVGHPSCQIPGWVLMSPNSFHTNQTPGNDQVAMADMSKTDATTVKVWGHQHDYNRDKNYLNQPQAVTSPSGSRVLFASDWGTGIGYAFVAEQP